MAARTKLRLHYPDGHVVVEPLARTARENGTDVAGVRALVKKWVAAGDLVERRDGGYDVKRHRPRATTGG